MLSVHHAAGSLSLKCCCILWITVLGLAVAVSPAYAQHSASAGHAAGGAHAAGGSHPIGPSTHAQSTPHLTYVPRGEARSESVGRSAQPFFQTQRRFRARSFQSQQPFGLFNPGYFPPAFGFWPWWGWSDCDSFATNCNYGEVSSAEYPESSEEEDVRPMIIVYLRDGSGYGALDYWLAGGSLHIETTYAAEKSFPIGDVDLERTVKENYARGFGFVLYPAPLTSDPGPMFAPDSYAPACQSVSQPAQPVASAAPAPTASEKFPSGFGASGATSERGFAVSSVFPDSPAALVGIQPGDIVERINCQRVRSMQDIDNAVTNSRGTIWVSYLIQGTWLTEKKLIAP
jgi:hypothetical protein